MHDQSKQDDDVDAWTERLVVLQVLDRPGGRSGARIYRELDDIERDDIDAAISSLTEAGVVTVRRSLVRQSRALERLDRLQLICV